MSAFDPQAFLDQTIDTPLVKRPPADVGVYTGVIGEPKTRTWQGRKDPTKSGIALDLPIEVQLTPDVASKVGQSAIIITDSVMLDITESGGLDMSPGRNRKLRVYYDATDLNKPGTSPRMLQGRMVKVQVSHDIVDGETYERIQSVAKA